MFKIIRYCIQKIAIKFIIKEKNNKKRFTKIFETNYWGDLQSYSGPGSNIKNTRNLTKELNKIIKRYKIKSIVDAPCGDFFWINKVIKQNNLKYLGIDIVDDLIRLNKKKYQNNRIKFFNYDILENRIPECDLIICRDFLFHLSTKDIKKFFRNLKKSKFKYILISNHALNNNITINKDIQSGDFRKINLFKEPFNLKRNFDFFINDYCDGKEKYLLFYKAISLKLALQNFLNKKIQ